MRKKTSVKETTRAFIQVFGNHKVLLCTLTLIHQHTHSETNATTYLAAPTDSWEASTPTRCPGARVLANHACNNNTTGGG